MSTYRPTNRPITHQRDVFPQPITALSFDPVSDVLWSGSNSGGIVAYCTPEAIRGVSFPVGGNLAVTKIIAGDTYVRAHGLGSDGVGTWNKGGVNKWYFRSSSAITAFSNVSASSHILAAASASPELILLNDLTGDVVRRIPAPSRVNHLHLSHTYLLSGSSDGYVRTHDPRGGGKRLDGGAEGSVFAHAGGVQGLQSSGNYVYTIGWGFRQSRPFPDPLVKVYDLRSMRPLPPLPFSDGPSFISTLPKRDSTIVVVSNQGLINIVDISNPSASEFYQLETASIISSAAVSPTGAYLAFGDSDGVIHLMTAAEGDGAVPFNGFEGQPVEWADRPESLPDIDWNDSTPLNIIGLPYYNSLLLSSWTGNFISRGVNYAPPASIPPRILNTMKMNDNIAYATLPKELRGRRNMVFLGAKDTGRFRSGKPRKSSEVDSPDFNAGDIPRVYRKVEIEYSKFGVEDFDFGFYNTTEYSGLETHILNSYTNPIIQVMHYLYPIRQLAKSHITTNCPREHCLLCELGFVARMLEDAKGTNCQASNFCKTVGVLAQAKNLIELIDYGRDSVGTDYAQIIQSFHRFLVDHLTVEGDSFPYNPSIVSNLPSAAHTPAPAPITQLLGIDARTVVTCMNCRSVRSKENMTHVMDMIYPRKTPSGESIQDIDFPSIVRNSLLRQMTYKATCLSCKQFSVFESYRSISTRDLPPILAMNTSIYNRENIKFWVNSGNQKFLKPRIQLNGQVDGVDDPESAIYELTAIVVQVVAKNQGSHLVAIIKVPDSEKNPAFESPWFVFNDFVVRNISGEEALSFPDTWKVPAVVYMERVDTRDEMDYSGLLDEIDPSVLSRDTNIAANRDASLIRHDILRPEELPQPGTLVSIDAEFVSMQQEETEYRSDGTKKVIRPARLSLARVSVLRGNGPKEGVPFIDDHIHTSEIIVDYLTEFSGIKFGDLDPHLSPYTLTPLKLVYKKLRLLVDRGCIFIGHGLSKDFRIINIFVPPEQVIDTVDLYFIKARQRRLSLKFLTWFVLNENIQTEVHDSIEDARSALRLYKAYHEFEEQGIFDDKLDELYREGKQYNWKPPAAPQPISSPQIQPASAPATRSQFSMIQGNLLQSGFGPTTNFSSAHFGMQSFFGSSSSSTGQSWDR